MPVTLNSKRTLRKTRDQYKGRNLKSRLGSGSTVRLNSELLVRSILRALAKSKLGAATYELQGAALCKEISICRIEARYVMTYSDGATAERPSYDQAR
jgi:hypothetical protein